jgi:hypothetical protein
MTSSGLASIVLPLLIGGCQSFSTPRVEPVAVQCRPAPAAWFMEEHASELTKRMRNEFSPGTLDRLLWQLAKLLSEK